MTSLTEIFQSIWKTPSLEKPVRDGLINLSSNTPYHSKIKSLHQLFLSQTSFFSDYPNYEQLRRTCAAYYGFNFQGIGFSAGSDLLIVNLLQIAKNLNRKNIILQKPAYYNYNQFAKRLDLAVCEIPFKEILSEKTLQYLSKCEPTFIFLISPCPHTGEIIKIDELKKWISIISKFGHYVVLDQAYSGFGSQVYLPLCNENDSIFIFQTFSKAYGAAGLRFAIFWGTSEITLRLRSIGIEDAVSKIAVEYAFFVYNKMDDFKEIQEEICLWRTLAYQTIKKKYPDFFCFNSLANFISVDTRQEEIASAVIDLALHKYKIFLKKQPSPSCLRITVTDPDTFNLLFMAIDEVMNSTKLSL